MKIIQFPRIRPGRQGGKTRGIVTAMYLRASEKISYGTRPPKVGTYTPPTPYGENPDHEKE